MDPRRWEEIQTAFDEVVELDPPSRVSRLATLGTTDPALRQAVESLLAADAEAEARLAALEAALLPQAARAADPLDLAGRTVSHFDVLEPLGAGGMGVVYRAQDTRLGRSVALKFLLPAYSLDAAAKARFLREAHSAAALDHPNLCTVYDVGTTDDGRLFLAMALYPGETLKARLARDGPLPLAEGLEIARQVAVGLESAHAAGIVHRDLKPGNIMLLPDGTVKILDFGLAKARDQSLSEPGPRFGTVSYMAPEQIRGETVDGRTDLWALGVVLYEMLTGRKPFGGEEEIAVAHAILHDEPDLPSTHRGDVSAAMEDLVLRLLHKDPATRYPAAAELPNDLARVGTLAEGAFRAVRARWLRARRALRGHERRMVAVGAALVVGALGYAAVARQTGDPAAAPVVAAARTAIAVLPFQNLSAKGPHAYFAGGLHEEILTQLYKVPGLKVIGRTSVIGYSGPNVPPLKQVANELGVGSIVQGSVQVVGNRVRVNVQLMDPRTDAPLWVERYDRTLADAFAIQSDIARQIVATVGASLSGVERNALTQVPTNKAQAYLLYLQAREYDRRPGHQLRNMDSAMALDQRALTLDPSFALAHAALSNEHRALYFFGRDHAPDRLARARAEADLALRLAPDLPEALHAMAAVHVTGPQTDLRAFYNGIEAALRGAPNDARLWKALAHFQRTSGNWEQYDRAFNKAVELDPRDVDLLQDYGGETHERMGRHAEAIRWYNRALGVDPNALPFSIDKAWVYVSWQGQRDTLRAVMSGPAADTVLHHGWIRYHCHFLLVERQADSLFKLLKWARAAAPRVAHIQTSEMFYPYTLLAAWAHQLRGENAAARAAFDSALVFIDSAIAHGAVDWSVRDWPVRQARGMALAGLGRRDDALGEVRWLRESAVYLKDRFLGPYAQIGVAQILAQAGEADAAVDELRRMLADPAPAITVHTLRLEPLWDPIREDPRFRALLAKYGT